MLNTVLTYLTLFYEITIPIAIGMWASGTDI